MKKINYGEYLRKARKARDLNQEQFSELIGISQTTCSRIENGTVIPTPEMFEKITEALKNSQPVSAPEIEQLDYDTLVTTRGMGIARILPGRSLSIVTTIIKIAFALPLMDVAYDFGRGICDGLQTSANTNVMVSSSFIIIMLGIYYYWLKRLEKRWLYK